MKILEIIATIGPGGAETLASELAIDFSRRGGEVRFFLLAGIRGERGEHLEKRIEDAGIIILGKHPRKPASLHNLLQLIKTINTWQPDILHCHLYNSDVACTIASFFTRHTPALKIRTLHNVVISSITRSKVFSRILCRFFDYHVACSQTVKDSIPKIWCPLKPVKGLAIPNGCALPATENSHNKRKDARKEFNLTKNDLMIAHIGRFDGESLATGAKGHDTLLKAFATAFCNKENVFLLCAGDGPLRREAEQLTHDLKISHQVQFLGNIPHAWTLLRAADIFTLPSRHEGLPITLLEAAALGLPVIASNIPEIKSLSPANSWLLSPVDDVSDFARNFHKAWEDYQSISQIAQQQTSYIRENYSIERCGQDYWNLFNQQLNNPQ